MATVKIKFRSSSRADKAGTLFYQVIHNRVTRQIYTGYKLFPYEWNAAESKIFIPADCDAGRSSYLSSLRGELTAGISRLSGIISRLERAGIPYNTDKVVELYGASDDDGCFISFATDLIRRMSRIGKSQVAAKYTTAVNSFKRFRGECDVPMDDMDSNLMLEYEQWLKETGACKNTTSFYMRNLRAIYNRAAEKVLTVQRFPFRHVYTGIDKTVKRALPAKTIREIKRLDLSRTPQLDYARDLFMFSFYTRGMSFIDMAFLKKKDLQNGILVYRRKKTSQQLTIRWEKPMQEIIAKYDTGDSPYLLPIIKEYSTDLHTQYINAAHTMNDRLKKIGERIGLEIPLTSYVARHSWASIARSKNISISIISEAMGHDSESTTRIYLASLDTSSVDKANSIVLSIL